MSKEERKWEAWKAYVQARTQELKAYNEAIKKIDEEKERGRGLKND